MKLLSKLSRLAFVLAMLGALSFGTAEILRANGETNNACINCEGNEWCDICCGAGPSICLTDGQCLCA